MKILTYCPVYYPQNGGYANAFLNIHKLLLTQKDIEIDVITPQELGKEKELEFDRLNIVRINDKPIANFKKFPIFLSKILAFTNFFIQPYKRFLFLKQYLEKNYDVIIIETIEEIMLLNYIPTKYYKNILIRIHATEETEGFVFKNSILNIIKRLFAKKLIKQKVKYICSTNNFHNNFVKKYYLDENVFNISSKTFFVLPNTLDEKEIGNLKVCEDYNISHKKIKILSLGRMNKDGYLQKSFDDLLNGLILLDEKIKNKIEVYIIGDGEYKGYIEKKALYNNLPVKMVGSVNHKTVMQYLKESDIVLLLSLFEGCSMFALEALASKNIVIFSNTGGLKDMVKNNGFLVEPKNIEDFQKKLELILNNKNLEQKKEKSLEIYNNYFSNKVIIEKFKKILKIIESNNYVTR